MVSPQVNDVAHHGPTGTVKWFNATKGYGFIEPEDGSKDAFIHISAVERARLATLREGQRVSYELRPGRDGKSSAEELSVADQPLPAERAPSLAGLTLPEPALPVRALRADGDGDGDHRRHGVRSPR